MASNADNYHDDELQAPEWLNEEFVTKIIANYEKSDKVKVLSHKITPGTVKGDHYASVMFRIVVKYEVDGAKKEKSLILKTLPEAEGHKKEMFKESKIFETEIGMYTEVIPKFEEILRSVGDETVFCARCIYHSLEPRKVIVFQDLVPEGFDVLRTRFLTFDEIKLTLEKLSKWQAISYKIINENPSFFDKYRYAVMNNSQMCKQEFFTDGIGNFLKFLDTQPNLLKYKPYFQSIEKNMLSRNAAAASEYRENPQKDVTYVLCHGDFHVKNLMVKHNPTNGNLEDLMLLDFQFSYVSSWAMDLIYTKYAMINSDLRINRFDELVYHYYSVFRDTLQKIGFDGRMPKYQELRSELIRNKAADEFLLSSILPMWHIFLMEAPPVAELMTSPDFRSSIYQSAAYIEEINLLLPKLLHLGYFDE